MSDSTNDGDMAVSAAGRDWLPGAGGAFPLSRGGWATERGGHLHQDLNCRFIAEGHRMAEAEGKDTFARTHLTSLDALTRGLRICHGCWHPVPTSDRGQVLDAWRAHRVDDASSSARNSVAGQPDFAALDDEQREHLRSFLAGRHDALHDRATPPVDENLPSRLMTARALAHCPSCGFDLELDWEFDGTECPLCQEDLTSYA